MEHVKKQLIITGNNPAKVPFFQPKLTVGAVNDPLEREADAMADRVMRAPERPISRKCPSCEEKEKIARKPLNFGKAFDVSSSFADQLSVTKGGGNVLPRTTARRMGQHFGTDFSEVRIHTDSTATQLNDRIQARAFTHGRDIYFNRGEYNPASASGKHLLAHELTHVVQQGGVGSTVQRTAQTDTATESNGVVSNLWALAESISSSIDLSDYPEIQQLLDIAAGYTTSGTVDVSEDQVAAMRRLEQLGRQQSLISAVLPGLPLMGPENTGPSGTVQRTTGVLEAGAAGALMGGGAITLPAWVVPALIVIAIIIIILAVVWLVVQFAPGTPPTAQQEAEAKELVRRVTDTSPRPAPRPAPRPRPGPVDPPPPPSDDDRRRRKCYPTSIVLAGNPLQDVATGPTPENLRLAACATRLVTGVSNQAFSRKNIAVGEFSTPNNGTDIIASANPERNYHSEDMVLTIAENRYGANNYVLRNLFTERRPCGRCAPMLQQIRTVPDFKVYCIINNDYAWQNIRQQYLGGS